MNNIQNNNGIDEKLDNGIQILLDFTSSVYISTVKNIMREIALRFDDKDLFVKLILENKLSANDYSLLSSHSELWRCLELNKYEFAELFFIVNDSNIFSLDDENDVDVNIKYHNKTALDIACENLDCNAIKFLLKHDAEITNKNLELIIDAYINPSALDNTVQFSLDIYIEKLLKRKIEALCLMLEKFKNTNDINTYVDYLNIFLDFLNNKNLKHISCIRDKILKELSELKELKQVDSESNKYLMLFTHPSDVEYKKELTESEPFESDNFIKIKNSNKQQKNSQDIHIQESKSIFDKFKLKFW